MTHKERRRPTTRFPRRSPAFGFRTQVNAVVRQTVAG